MSIPLRYVVKIGGYVLKQHLTGAKRYPLVLMMEPLFRCNLACAGCGKIDYPDHILNQRLSVTLCTDNRLVSRTTVTDEYRKAVEAQGRMRADLPYPALTDPHVTDLAGILDPRGDGKTAQLAKQIKSLGWKRVLIIDGAEVNENFAQAARNIEGLDILPSMGANVMDILKRDTLVITKAGVEALEARLK